jgi:hypothetical protein
MRQMSKNSPIPTSAGDQDETCIARAFAEAVRRVAAPAVEQKRNLVVGQRAGPDRGFVVRPSTAKSRRRCRCASRRAAASRCRGPRLTRIPPQRRRRHKRPGKRFRAARTRT